MKIFRIFSFLFILTFSTQSVWAYWVWSPEQGKFVNPEGGAAQDAAEEQFNYAMTFQREDNTEEAIKQLEDLLKKYPASRVAPEAQYRLGTIHEANEEYLKAYNAYKVIVKSYPQSDRMEEVIEREYRIGQYFLSGERAKVLGLQIWPAMNKSVEIFDHIVKNAPYGKYGDQAQFQKGIAYKKMKRFAEAQEAFQTLIDQYPQSDLATQARFQIAETSYERSAHQYRDQRALDEARRSVDGFIDRHPEAEASEEAVKLRQIIDEKNAEKNYRVGLFYEKQNQLKSALIYYEDVAVRYPHTKWGKKSREKMNALESPAEYLTAREKELADQKKEIENKLKNVAEGDKDQEKDLKRQWKSLDEQKKSIDEAKAESLKTRRDDIRRREKELEGRFKKLENKRKDASDNTSEDFARALDRWEQALIREKDELIQERNQLESWHEELGVKQVKGFWPDFGGPEATEVEKVNQIEAKKLYKLSEDKKNLFIEKEALYKELDEVSGMLGTTSLRSSSFEDKDSEWLENVQADSVIVERQQAKLKNIRSNIERLEKQVEEKRAVYEKQHQSSTLKNIAAAPGRIVKSMNPLSWGSKEALAEKDTQELLELRMHLKQRISAQQNISETLAKAFDQELAIQEQKRLLEKLNAEEELDPHKLRKSVKTLEKQIRANYQEIDDRDKKKKKLVKELNQILEGEDSSGKGFMKKVASPIVGTGSAIKAFIFGAPDEGEKVTDQVNRLSAQDQSVSSKAREISETIELESLIIDAKSREIINLEKKLEILKAKASLAGGYKFRSSFVEVPYEFIGSAIESAKKVVPKKKREEILMNNLNDETRELEKLRAELKEVEKVIDSKSPKAMEELDTSSLNTTTVDLPESTKEDAERMKNQIEGLMNRLENEHKAYEQEKKNLKQKLKDQKSTDKVQDKLEKAERKEEKQDKKRREELQKEVRQVHRDLSELIEKEQELESKETEILMKRVSYIDEVLGDVKSKAMTQDLLNEKEQIQDRISQIELRKDFLTKEMERFRMGNRAA